MESIGVFVTFAVALVGALAVAMGVAMARRPAGDVEQYLRDLEDDGMLVDDFERKLAQPFFVRVVRPLTGQMTSVVARLTPRGYIESVHKKILVGGLAGTLRAEEFVVAQAASFTITTILAVGWVILAGPSTRIAVLVLVLLPMVGLLLPVSWLTRKVDARKDAIRKDLPDTLDLLAISVEAGMGFEGALAIVTEHFDSPLAREFHLTLKEMELGLPRRDAFQNLKRRTEVPELSNFVLALMQADALGIPVGRVLRTQAVEMRNKRRQWAREKAAKLPVKILFPLVLFIFPSIMVVVMGPAASTMGKLFS
jgi:tight adherence protein C